MLARIPALRVTLLDVRVTLLILQMLARIPALRVTLRLSDSLC